MKKKLLFLYLFFTLFFIHQKIQAAFFEPSPLTQNYGSIGEHAYTTQWDPSGNYLAVGGVNYPDDVTIYQWDGIHLYPYNTQTFGNGAYALNWTPNGKYLAVGGNFPDNAFIVYKWDGKDLTQTTSKYNGSQVNAVAWNPDGNTLAVGSNWGNNTLALYSWDGISSLTLTGSKYHGTKVNALAWNPAGTKLAVAGNNRTCNLALYSWSGSALTLTTSKHHGAESYAVSWSNSGDYLAVGGNYNTSDVIIYTLSGSTLTLTTSISFGNKANTLQWSFDDRYLTVGGDNGDANLIVYEWDGTILNKIHDSQKSYGSGIYALNWSPYAEYLSVAGNNGTSDVTIYKNHGYLNGTKNNVTLNNHYLFTDGGYANGAVNISNGCTVLPNQTLKLALNTQISGGLDLRNTGILQLEDDVYFDANITLSTGGIINGKDHALYLNNNLNVPDNSIIHITSDTIIDGNGHNLKLGHASQLYVDSNITLTLRNLTLENTLNTTHNPPIKLATLTSKLALDNVEFTQADDFYFNQGQLFIHNDVAITGSSKFIYSSAGQSYITKNATLYFDHETTLNYAPLSNNKTLLALQDASSRLYLNNSTLLITHTGMRISKGHLYLDNNINFNSALTETSPDSVKDTTFTYSQSYGDLVRALAWDRTGEYLVAGGIYPTDGDNQIQIFRFNGSYLTKIPGAFVSFGTYDAQPYAYAWSPDNQYVLVAGSGPTDGNELQIFRFNGTTLTKITGANYTTSGYLLSGTWSPDGTHIVIGGLYPTDGNQVQIYSFNGTTLTKITGVNLGGTAQAVDWNPNGSYIAIGGRQTTDGKEILVYSFNGTSLTQIPGACLDYGFQVLSVAWSPDGKTLAVGGNSSVDGNGLQLYSFDETSLTKIPGACVPLGDRVFVVRWSPNGKELVTGGYDPSGKDIQVFYFNGTSLTQITDACKSYGSEIISAAWNPNGDYIAIGGYIPDAGLDRINIFHINPATSYQTVSNSLLFGNSALGPDYNLDVTILAGTKINKNCFVTYDQAI